MHNIESKQEQVSFENFRVITIIITAIVVVTIAVVGISTS